MLSITTYQRMQINTTARYHHSTLVRVAIIKNICAQSVLERVWRKGSNPTLLVGM